MVKSGEREIAKVRFYAAKRPIKTWDVNVGNIVISKLVKTKTNSKYLIGYLDETIRALILKMPKMTGYVMTFKVEEGNNKLMPFRIDNGKLLEKYKAIWTRIEDFKNIKLNALPVYDDRYIKTKIRTFGDKVYTNFRGLNVPEDDIQCGSFTIFSIDSLLVYNKKYYLQVYLGNCAYEIVNKQITDYLDENLFEDQIL